MTKRKLTAKREYGLISEIGRFPDGKWVVRNEHGQYVDMDRYSNDLRDKYREDQLVFEGE